MKHIKSYQAFPAMTKKHIHIAVAALVAATIFITLFAANTASATNSLQDATTASAYFTGTNGDELGYDVAPVGDFDGDGYDDFVIGAPGDSGYGAAYLVYGDSGFSGDISSTSLLGDLNADGQDDVLKLSGDGNISLGTSIASGDFDGDGSIDLAIGAAHYDELYQRVGAVYLVYGNSERWTGEHTLTGGGFTYDTNTTVQTAVFYGYTDGTSSAASLKVGENNDALAVPGDVDGDGKDDLLIGVPNDEEGGNVAGAVYVLYGDSYNTVEALTPNASYIGKWYGGSYDTFGEATAGGDINGDGYADMLLGGPNVDTPTRNSSVRNSGVVYVVYGDTVRVTGSQIASNSFDVVLYGQVESGYMGNALLVEDIDEDGLLDMIVAQGEYRYTNGEVFIVYGATNLPAQIAVEAGTTGVGVVEGEALRDYYGYSISTVDIDADGHKELLAGAPENDVNGTSAGAVYVHHFDGRTVSELDSSTSPVVDTDGTEIDMEVFYGETSNDDYGDVVSTLGDINGDGCEDYMMSAVDYPNASAAGRVYLHYGDSQTCEDSRPAEVYLYGESVVTVDIGDGRADNQYEDDGIYVYDERDGVIFDSGNGDYESQYVTISNPLENLYLGQSELGTYTITYDVVDSDGNQSDTVTRIVHVVDTQAPAISLTTNEYTIDIGDGNAHTFTAESVVASDAVEGILSVTVDNPLENVTLQSAADFGDYEVVYTAQDSSGNIAEEIVVVHVLDGTAPEVTVNCDTTLYIEYGQYAGYSGDCATDPTTAYDVFDGAVSVSIDNPVNVNVLGTYVVTYSAADSYGNVGTAIRTVEVVDTTAPTIQLYAPTRMILAIGGMYTTPTASATDTYDGDVTASVVVDDSAVDVYTPGTYIVTITAEDSNGNVATTTQTVIVRSNVAVDTTSRPASSLVGRIMRWWR